ncbi:helix-turn-helix domain-containing protein [Celeribacter sp. ULVN23_4]
MRTGDMSPAQLRHVFGANLRALSAKAPSISALCIDLGINRTQYNRYLNGEAFPRPDVLYRICKHFDVDARILLEPLDDEEMRKRQNGAIEDMARTLSDLGALSIAPADFPEGAYLHYRASYFEPTKISCTLTGFYRDVHGVMRIKGYMPRASSDRLGLPHAAAARKFRAVVFRQLMGFSFVLTMTHTPLMVLGGFRPGYLGQEDYYFGSSISTQDVMTSSPLLLRRLKPGMLAMLAARKEIGLHARPHYPPLIRGYFDKHAPLS